jgi:hypothetical protein
MPLLQELRSRLLAEAEASARQNADVASRWPELYEEEVPQELFKHIERQQRLCCGVIEAKQDLIAGGLPAAALLSGCCAGCLAASCPGPAAGWVAGCTVRAAAAARHCLPILPPPTPSSEVRKALLHKDEEYVKLLKRQGDEVDGLLSYMTQQ